MTEPITPQEPHRSFLSQHRYLFLVGFTIIISLVLVSISLLIYNLSGDVQLDLSRPGYQSVSNNITSDENALTSYPASGPVNSQTINDFKSTFTQEASSSTAVDAFNGDPLSPDSLGYGATDPVDATNY